MSTAFADPENEREERWTRAYLFTVSNAALFFALSVLSLAFGVTTIAVNSIIALIFMAGAMVSAAMLVRAGEGLVAIAFFVAGAGVTFGFGTAYATIAPPDFATRLLFYEDRQREVLGTINLVNSLSVLCVLISARLMIRFRGGFADAENKIMETLGSLSNYSAALIYVSGIIVILEILTFPVPQNLLLRSVMQVLSKIPLATLVMVFAQWPRLGLIVRILGFLIASVLVWLGILTTAKTAALLPVVAIIAGLWLNPATRRLAIGTLIFGVVAYFAVLAPLSQNARTSANYTGGVAGLSAAMKNLSTGASELKGSNIDASPLLRRFSSAPYQSYLIAQHDAGNRGHSLDEFWVALIPRALWADKPNVTRFGGDLYGAINHTTAVSSALAPTYSAEAYWNYGWLGVIIVSIIVGLQLGWLTQKWLDLAGGIDNGPGILVMSIPVALHGFWVETWGVATYVGGFVTLYLLIVGLNTGARFLAGLSPQELGAGSASTQRVSQ